MVRTPDISSTKQGPGDPPATMVFIQHQQPPLNSGDYEITVQQTITVDEATHQFPPDQPQKQSFSVQGARFVLSPALVASQFPPANQQGAFGDGLPHVVLMEPTLPWQRGPADSTLSAQDAPADVAPWLAILLVDESDFASGSAFPAPTSVKVADLLATAPTGIYFPPLPKEKADDPTSSCQVVDLQTALFNRIAPRLADLPWLAHTRTVNGGTMGRKVSRPTRRNRSLKLRADGDPGADDGNFAVVIGNRFAREGSRAQAYLCSLEGYGPSLPTASGPILDPAAFPFVRLVVLSNWAFTAIADEGSFHRQLEQLNAANTLPTTLRLPASPDASFAPILEMGYVPLGHRLRTGDRTVSWYRGPLTPRAVPLLDALTPGASVSDTLLHYDPATGLLDASHAAAWQIGRTLALNSKDFSAALYAWREGNLRSAATAVANRKVRNVLARDDVEAADDSGRLRPLLRNVLGDVLKTSLERLAAGSDGPAPSPRRGDSFSPAAHPAGLDEAWDKAIAELPDDLPASVADWLGALSLCHGVPFNYLVADPGLLPQESIRFFQIDPNWIANLVDGALSIGRTSPSREAHDRHVRTAAHGAAAARAAVRRDRSLGGPADAEVSAAPAATSGFLLRSRVVQGWPGLEIRAYSDAEGTEPLTIVRLETLAPSVLICLVAGPGPIARVDIRQPSEGVHFGVDWDDDSTQAGFKKILRSEATGSPGSSSVTGTVSADRVLDVAALAASIETALGAGPYTAAEFGLQMIEGVAQVTFKSTASKGRAAGPAPAGET